MKCWACFCGRIGMFEVKAAEVYTSYCFWVWHLLNFEPLWSHFVFLCISYRQSRQCQEIGLVVINFCVNWNTSDVSLTLKVTSFKLNMFLSFLLSLSVLDLVDRLLKSLVRGYNYRYYFIFRVSLLAAMQEVIAEWRGSDETGSDVPTIQTNLFFLVEFLIIGRGHMTADQLQIREASFRVVSLVLWRFSSWLNRFALWRCFLKRNKIMYHACLPLFMLGPGNQVFEKTWNQKLDFEIFWKKRRKQFDSSSVCTISDLSFGTLSPFKMWSSYA